LLARLLRWQARDDGVEQIARPLAVDRRNDERFAEAQASELTGDLGLHARGLRLVCDEQHRAPRAPHDRGHVVVERRAAGLRVDDEDDDVGLARGRLRLVPRRLRDGVARGCFVVDPAGVDDAERAAAPLSERVEAVARHAGRVVDDGEAAADQTIEQRALPDVRPADDRHGGWAQSLGLGRHLRDIGDLHDAPFAAARPTAHGAGSLGRLLE
jgi:hypothetical protein